MDHIAIAERAMVRTTVSVKRVQLITSGCSVSERRARRLIKAVNMLWHYRAKAFGTPAKARTKILPKVQALFEEALAKGSYSAALGALKLEAELCGLSKQEIVELPVADESARADVGPETERVAERVLDRLLRHGLGGNGKGNGRAQA